MIEELRGSKELLYDFIDTTSSVPILLIDEQRRISDSNNGFMKLFSLSDKPIGVDIADFIIPGAEGIAFDAGIQQFTFNPRSGLHGVLTAHRLPQRDHLLLWCERPLITGNQVVERISFLNNEFIAMQRELDKKNYYLKQVQEELTEKVAQLEAALSTVRRLEGIIPICMYCHNIRDEEELWHNIERYITEHSDAEFSHGICPDCFAERFGAEIEPAGKTSR
jgi:hypothetical protein